MYGETMLESLYPMRLYCVRRGVGLTFPVRYYLLLPFMTDICF